MTCRNEEGINHAITCEDFNDKKCPELGILFVDEVGILSDLLPLFNANLIIACLESEMISESF